MSILDYHDRTKHSAASLQSNRHYLDWDNQPLPFKIYRGLEPIPLPRDIARSDVPALSALRGESVAGQREWIPDRAALARLLYLSAGITRRKTYAGGHEMQFRAAACTGALYHIDIYLVAGALPDLEAGVYHFSVHDFSLRRLRAGDHRGTVVAATGEEDSVAAAPALLVLASTYWRNAWKYQARAYRHAFWDSGTILANLLATGDTMGAPLRLITAFVDEQIEALLGLDPEREGAIAIVALGHGPDRVAAAPQPLEPLRLETEPLSADEVDYPAIRAAHRATSLASADQVRAFRSAVRSARGDAAKSDAAAAAIPLRPLAPASSATLDRTIVRRGSTRHFARSPISFEQLSSLLTAALGRLHADFLPANSGLAERLGDTYVIVNAVDGIEPGTYVATRDGSAIEPLRRGDFRQQAGNLDLGQELGADASTDFYILADLDSAVKRFGERGYRAAALEAAIAGGRIYLAAYALGFGATGLTFFDDDVTRFFSPHAAGKGVMFLVAVGHPSK